MKNRNVFLLAAVLVVLAGLAWLAGAFEADFSTLDPPKWGVELEEVSELRIYAPGDTLIFSREESGRWRMQRPIGDRADSAAIVRKLQELSELTVASLVTSNPDRYAKYGADSTATRIVITENGSEEQLLLGSAATGSGSFVRIGDDPRVFVARPMLTMPLDPDRWRDRTIVSVPAARVSRVTVTGTADDYVVSRGPSGWQVVRRGDATAADSAGVQRWLGRFSPLRGDSFVSDADGALVEPVGILRFELDTGASLSLHVRRDNGRLLVDRPDDGVVLSVSSGRQASLLPASESLLR